MRVQTSDNSEIAFAPADCDGLSLCEAVRKFVVDPHARELGEVVGAFRSNGWIWLRARGFDPEDYPVDGFGDEAVETYGHTCSPIYEDGSFIVQPGEVESIISDGVGRYKFDRISDPPLHDDPQDFLRVLHHLSRYTTVFNINMNTATYGGVDFVWPVDLADDVLIHTIRYWRDWAEEPASLQEIKNVAQKMIAPWRLLFGYIAKRELSLVGADRGVKRYNRERLTLTSKHFIDVWTGDVIMRECGFEGLIHEKQWRDVLLTKREVLPAIDFNASGGPAKAIASITNPPQAVARSPDKERKNKGGKRLSVGKAIYTEIIRIANTPDGLPSRDELMCVLMKRFPDAGESNVRSILADVYSSLASG